MASDTIAALRRDFTAYKADADMRIAALATSIKALQSSTALPDLARRVAALETATALADLAKRVAVLEASKPAQPAPVPPPAPPPPPPAPAPVPVPPPPGPSAPTPGKLLMPGAHPTGMSNILASGSIDVGSNLLRLTANPGFRKGDPIVVATGAELVGRGERGTEGVGGSWPKRQFADEAQLRANYLGASFPVDGYYVKLTGRPETWWLGKSDANIVTLAQDPYHALRLPLALIARVIDVSSDGLIATLDKPAKASAQNATVHFDNYWALMRVIAEPGDTFGATKLPDGFVLNLPEGYAPFAISAPIESGTNNGFLLAGNGAELFSPAGTNCASLYMANSPGTVVQDLTLRGNHGPKGYVHHWNWWRNPDSFYEGDWGSSGLVFNTCNGGRASRCKLVDHVNLALGVQYSGTFTSEDIEVVANNPIHGYLGWQFNYANSHNGLARRIKIKSAYLTRVLEPFQCLDTRFEDVTIENGIVSSNSSSGFVWKNWQVTLKENCWYDEQSLSHFSPIIQTNSNINRQQGLDTKTAGGTLENVNVTMEGPIGHHQLPSGRIVPVMPGHVININPDNDGVQILGGKIVMPNMDDSLEVYAPPSGESDIGTITGFVRAINSTGSNTLVDGTTVEFGVPKKVAPGDWLDPVSINPARGGVERNITLINRMV